MRLSRDRLDAASLAELGLEARQLLVAGDISALSQLYGYALAFDREPANAIRAELASSLAEIDASELVGTDWEEPCVSYFKPNETGLLALVECLVPTENGHSILIEVIITMDGEETHATLEQLSAAV
jgi:hypothetical protein